MNKKIHVKNILVIFILCLFIFVPYFQKGIFRGLDDSFHLSRIYSLSQSIQNGIFPVKVHSCMCYGTGYGVGFGYSNLFLYIPALLIWFGFSLIQAYKMYVFLVVFAMGVVSYYALIRLSNNAYASLIGCVVVLFSNRIWWDIYGLMSLGSLQASVFIMPAIVGMYCFLTREEERPTILVVGFVGLIYSHVISTFLVFTVCACLVIWFWKNLVRYKKKILELIWSVGLVLGITASFWLPLIEQLKKQVFKLSSPWTTAEEHVETIERILAVTGVGIVPLGTLAIVSIAIIILKAKGRYSLENAYSKCCFGIIAFVYVILSVTYSFWHFMNSVVGISVIQFPYRLYTPVIFLIVAQIVLLIADINVQEVIKKWLVVCGVILCILAFWAQYSQYSPYFREIDNSIVEAVESNSIAGVGGGEEWLPINGSREYMRDNKIAIDNEGNCIEGTKSRGYSMFTIVVDRTKEYYDLPYVYYKGYQAIGMNGLEYEVELRSDTGMLRVLMPENGEGIDIINVNYRGTKYQRLSYFVTIISACTGLFLYRRKKGALA